MNEEQALRLACDFGNRMRGAGVLVDGCGARIGRVSFLDWVDGFDAIEWALEFLGCSEWFFGVEHIALECAGRSMSFLNSGDTYDLTICREDDGAFFLSSWGDWLESAERSYDEENGTTGCWYCGERTACDVDDWSSTRCEHCGRNVSTGDVMPERVDDEGEGDDT